jgi:SMODS and SLOG-associating 2TM effector domain 1/Protein of unknown function (DUF4231)
MTSALDSAWQAQQRWSATATSLKRDLTLWRTAALGLSIAGAVIETLAAQLTDHPIATPLKYLGAVLLALGPIISAAKLGRDRIRAWIRARSASEGLKTEVFYYLTRIPPYGDALRDKQLVEHTSAITSRVSDLALHSSLIQVSSDEPPPIAEASSYIEHRVNRQIEGYYRQQARTLARRVSRLRGLEFVLGLVAAALGAIAAINKSNIAAWAAVVTTVSTAITAHIAAARYEYLVISYETTARRLESLRDGWNATPVADRRMEDLVRQCEEAISIENQGWMAEWSPRTDK